ncbi:MAG: hypothetical protein AAFQ82_26920, partial [Myxococcota bacterium]
GIPNASGRVLRFEPDSPDSSELLGQQLAENERYSGGVLAPNGWIYGIPSTATRLLRIRPEQNPVEVGQVGDPLGPDADKFSGATLNSSGLVVSLGEASSSVLLFDPGSPSGTQRLGTLSGDAPYFVRSVALGSDGFVYGAPANSPDPIRIDPRFPGEVLTVSELSSGVDKWRGMALAPDGRLFAAPYQSSGVLIITPNADPVPLSITASPFLNYY